MEFVVTDALPLRMVTKNSFQKLVIVLNSRVRCMGRKRLRRLISRAYRAFIKQINKEFNDTDHVCLTVDYKQICDPFKIVIHKEI